MRRLSSVLLTLGLASCGPPHPLGFDDDGDGDGLRVLFIGNSYTYTHDLPGMVENMAAASSIPVTIESLTHDGYYVASHLQHGELARLLARDFDVVVIQGQPFEPMLEYSTFESGVVEVVSMAGDARVVLYQTWPRRFDNPELIELGLSVEEMWAGLEHGYAQAAQAVDAEIATVGAAWMSALELEPSIELYSSDGNHPGYAGSYLAACVLFGVILDQTCTTNGWEPVGLAPEDRDRLRVVADVTNGKLAP